MHPSFCVGETADAEPVTVVGPRVGECSVRPSGFFEDRPPYHHVVT